MSTDLHKNSTPVESNGHKPFNHKLHFCSLQIRDSSLKAFGSTDVLQI